MIQIQAVGILQFVRHAIHLDGKGVGVLQDGGCYLDAVACRNEIRKVDIYRLVFEVGDEVLDFSRIDGVGEARQVVMQHGISLLIILVEHIGQQQGTVLVITIALVFFVIVIEAV